MGLWVSLGVALLLVVAVWFFLRRRANTPESWDGRSAKNPADQWRDSSGGGGTGM